MTGVHSLRQALAALHRWLGLGLAAWLVLAGLSGALLSCNHRLDAWAYPALRASAAAGPALDPLLVREQLAARYPQAVFDAVPLHTPAGRAMVFNTGAGSAPADFDQVFVHPHTGAVQGTRLWGDPSQGLKNLMPFIHRLHYSLAAGSMGTVWLGAVACAWAFSSALGLWLAWAPCWGRMPQGKSRWQGWRATWRVPWRASPLARLLGVHRALALWFALPLGLMACSALLLAWPEPSTRLIRAALPHQAPPVTPPPLAADTAARLSWAQAREAGRAHMHELARRHGFTLLHESALRYEGSRQAYRYTVRSSRDIGHTGGDTHLWLSAHTGAYLGLWLPTGQASGDTLSTWLRALHMARVGGWPWQWVLALSGLALASLAASGVLAWAVRGQRRRA